MGRAKWLFNLVAIIAIFAWAVGFLIVSTVSAASHGIITIPIFNFFVLLCILAFGFFVVRAAWRAGDAGKQKPVDAPPPGQEALPSQKGEPRESAVAEWFKARRGPPSRKQKVVIWIGVLTFIVLGLVPEWSDVLKVLLSFAVVLLTMIVFLLLSEPKT